MIHEGDRFGRLTVTKEAGVKNNRRLWECKCDCGSTKVVRQDCLTTGNTQSCGCLMREWQHSSDHLGSLTHGQSKTRLFRIWKGIKRRCLSPSANGYDHYGGRGITICDEWQNSFEAFQDWALANGYQEDLSIDRINVNGNYEPSNCRWATSSEQRANQRQKTISYKGEVKTVKEWSQLTGIKYDTLLWRVKKGWGEERIFAAPDNAIAATKKVTGV